MKTNSNEEVLKNVKQNLLIHLIQQRQLQFIGHILRKPGNELVNMYALFHPKHGKRNPGRLKLMFLSGNCQRNQPGIPTNTRRDSKHGTRPEGVEKARDRLQCSWLMMMKPSIHFLYIVTDVNSLPLPHAKLHDRGKTHLTVILYKDFELIPPFKHLVFTGRWLQSVISSS